MGRRAGVGKMYDVITSELAAMEKQLGRMKAKKSESKEDFATR
jgi:hypothetical protein